MLLLLFFSKYFESQFRKHSCILRSYGPISTETYPNNIYRSHILTILRPETPKRVLRQGEMPHYTAFQEYSLFAKTKLIGYSVLGKQ